MQNCFQKIALSSMLLLAIASVAVAQDDQPVPISQKTAEVEMTACRNNIEENAALNPAQKQMLEMQLSRFGFIQSILEQAKKEKIKKVDAPKPSEECGECDKCQDNADQSE